MKKQNMGYMERALTRRMTAVTDSLTQKYKSLYNTSDFISKIKYLSRCPMDEKGSVKAELAEMFEECGITPVDSNGTYEYYKELFEKNKGTNILSQSEMTHSVYKAFLKEFTENPFPLPEEYIERMVDGKIDEEWKEDTLRVKILKKFIKDARCLKAAGYNAGYIKRYAREKTHKRRPTTDEIVDSINDEIFQALADNRDKQRVRKTGTLSLLKIADDLASGRFGNPNVVREELYIFAIVFELTYFTGDPEEIVTDEAKARNIETVMFGDYYANNLMRYISYNHENITNGGEIRDPSGRGINYKNYMEVIFLYYLRRTDLKVVKRLEGVYSLAEKVHNMYNQTLKEDKSKAANTENNRTQFYTESFKLLELENEEEFVDFLVNNYDCSIAPERTPVFSIEAEQRTAVEIYKELLEIADEDGIKEGDFANNQIPFLDDEMDVNEIKKLDKKRKEGTLNFDELAGKTKFDIILYKVNKNLGKIKTENNLDEGIITRTDILRLYYHIYIQECGGKEDSSLRSLSNVYKDFTMRANINLTDAYLRPITGRDLYDLILIYSVYCNVNDDKI